MAAFELDCHPPVLRSPPPASIHQVTPGPNSATEPQHVPKDGVGLPDRSPDHDDLPWNSTKLIPKSGDKSGDKPVITGREHRKRIKSLCGAKPPQKLRWTNAGGGRRLTLWRFYQGRRLPGLIIAAQLGRTGWCDRSIAVASGAFKTIGSVIWSKAGAVGCVGGRRSPRRNEARDSKTERLRRRHTVLIMAPWPGAVSAA